MKRLLSLILVLAMALPMANFTYAAETDAVAAAEALNALHLFRGVGTSADGTTDYDLDRTPTRAEAITMLVRLLGKEGEALAGAWTTPFTDVDDWAAPYVGYAYANGLTTGTSAATFGSGDAVDAAQYLTFVLRALGYESGKDFDWERSYELTDKLGVTHGQYGAASAFSRGDLAIVSNRSLSATLKDSDTTLLDVIQSSGSQLVAAPPMSAFSLPQSTWDTIWDAEPGVGSLPSAEVNDSLKDKQSPSALDSLRDLYPRMR